MLEPEKLVEERLDALLGEIERGMNGDVITFVGQITYGGDDIIREAVEAIAPRQKRLIVILETPGGIVEVVQRIAHTFRYHYPASVEFVVPNYAMSAGTVLVMSGDAIHMDYYSTLGPIDPQIPIMKSGAQVLIPALGYLDKYNALIEKSRRGTITTAEVAYLLAKFDPGEIYQFEQARQLSISLLKEWLVQFKFKDWHKTETRGKTVTQSMKIKRAQAIATELSKHDRWHTHGRGISMEILRKDLRLKIEDFAAAPYGPEIKQYYSLLKGYMGRLGFEGLVHRRAALSPITFFAMPGSS